MKVPNGYNFALSGADVSATVTRMVEETDAMRQQLSKKTLGLGDEQMRFPGKPGYSAQIRSETWGDESE